MLVRTTGFRFNNGTEIKAQTIRSPLELRTLLEPICSMKKDGKTDMTELVLFARTFDSNGVPFAKFSQEVQKAILDGKIYSAMVTAAESRQAVPVILHKTLSGGYREPDHEPNGRGADLAPSFYLLTDPECVGRRGGYALFTDSSIRPENIFKAAEGK